MPRQIYSGQSKFHAEDEETKLAKQRAAARLRMAKLRQYKSNEYIINHKQRYSTKQVAMWRENQRQKQKNNDQASEQLISQRAIERYPIYNLFYF